MVLVELLVKEFNYGTIRYKTITVDLHGFRKRNAERVINNIISMYRFPFKLALIHGYNHGTVLKELIWNEYENTRIIDKETPVTNWGITYLSIN